MESDRNKIFKHLNCEFECYKVNWILVKKGGIKDGTMKPGK
jgi:hypothetical protein